MTGCGPDFSVLVVNWNGGETVLRCLAALEAQEEQAFETIVVDNASNDGSPALIRREHPRVRLVELDKNYGFAEGCNRGIAHTRGHWVLTLNSDAFPDPRWIAELRAAIRQAPRDVGMLQSHVVFEDRPNVINSTGVIISPSGMFVDRDYDVLDRLDRAVDEVFCPTAGAAAYRRHMLLETRLPTGFFDGTFFMYFEDVDLGWRCRLAGWKALYVPAAVVKHQLQASSRRRGWLFVPTHCRRNRARTMLKNASLRMLVLGGRQSLRDLIWLGRTQGVDGVASYATALFDGARQRWRVNRMLRRSRLEVEGRWVGV